MRSLVVSLPKAADRRAFMRSQLERLGIEYGFVDGAIGAEAIGDARYYDRSGALSAEGRELRPGEVGCALSHGRAYDALLESGLPWALVLEDDAILDERLPGVLSSLERGVLAQGDLVFLERCDYLRPFTARSLVGTFRIGTPMLVRAGATAQSAGYVITATAAEAIRGINLPVRFPADSWGHYRGKVRFLGVQPTLTLIRQSSDFASTTFGSGARRAFKKYPLWSLVAHDLLFYTALGRLVQRPLRTILKKQR